MNNIISHWKTSATAVLVGLLTAMLWIGKITPEQWMICMGGVTTAVGLMAKDWDKPAQ
jgi:hypothetical protein